MKPWSLRSAEVANHLAPSFVAVVLHEAARGHDEQVASPMPFELGFLIAPVALHSEGRAALPKTTRSLLPTWLLDNAALRAVLVDRACAMTTIVREGMLWGAVNQVLRIGNDGVQHLRTREVRMYVGAAPPDVAETVTRAHFLGKWFAKSGSAATTMALWGVRP